MLFFIIIYLSIWLYQVLDETCELLVQLVGSSPLTGA